ncbi:MAG: class I SAM-dependent methyltransferase [Acidobacteriota bacterium]
MTKAHEDEALEAERERIRAEVQRRRDAVPEERYAPWNPTEIFYRNGRRRVAAQLLRAQGAFPRPGDPCLEVGYGELGWLGELITWGLRVEDLHGVELDEQRAAVARDRLPGADLRVGDATDLPWPDGTFRLAVASTVFTSILDDGVRRRLAAEIERVLAPGGALLWYDFAMNNPRNPNVRRVTRAELLGLFPALEGPVRRVALAPPLARLVVPRSHRLAGLLEWLPFLRSHLLGVLVKR